MATSVDGSNKLFTIAFRVAKIETRVMGMISFRIKNYFNIHYDSLSTINNKKNLKILIVVKEIFLVNQVTHAIKKCIVISNCDVPTQNHSK